MRYVDWVDRVLVTIDEVVRRDPNAFLAGLGVRHLMQELQVGPKQHGDAAVVAAVNDLELLNCVEAGPLRIKITGQGQRFARAGGLRPGWKSLFQHAPIEEDRALLVDLPRYGRQHRYHPYAAPARRADDRRAS